MSTAVCGGWLPPPGWGGAAGGVERLHRIGPHAKLQQAFAVHHEQVKPILLRRWVVLLWRGSIAAICLSAGRNSPWSTNL